MKPIYPEELYDLLVRKNMTRSKIVTGKINTLLSNPEQMKEWVGVAHNTEENLTVICDETYSNGLSLDDTITVVRDGVGLYHIDAHNGSLQNPAIFIRSENADYRIVVDMEHATITNVPFRCYTRTDPDQMVLSDPINLQIEIKVYPEMI